MVLFWLGEAPIPAPMVLIFFFSSRRRHTISLCDWSSDVCSSDLALRGPLSLASLPLAFYALRLLTDPSDRLAERGLPRRRIRSEERRVGKSVDVVGRRMMNKST